jgi:DNA ligase 1
VQLLDVVTASTEVGASSARLKKIAILADLLRRAGGQGNAKLIAVVVSWLS